MNEKSETIRLQLYLARAGIGSRRKCEEYIQEGRVRVNGKKVTQLGHKVSTDDVIFYNKRRVFLTKKLLYIALHKPPYFLSSNKDSQGRALAIDLVKQAYSQRLFHVGRLDYLSSGLLFFTNDGSFARNMTHPSAAVEKEYLVETKEPLGDDLLKPFTQGVAIKGIVYRIKRFSHKGKRTVYITLQEGKNREIREIFQYLRFKILRLHRIRIASIRLKGLKPGECRSLTSTEIESLFKLFPRGEK